jgi:glycosyltransferase involved in cell wall biosynthesis
MGILDEEKLYPNVDEDKYIFFAGALYERYGVQILVDGFKKANVDAKLITAGQGPLSEYLATLADNNPRFVFLDVLSHEQIKQYEQHALLNINPRIFSEDLDKFSVPSKVIEYASSGRPTISTIHTGLRNIFNDSIYWLDTIDKNVLAKAINDVISDIDNATEKAKIAKEIAYKNFNAVKVVDDINKFLDDNFKK